MQEDPRNKRFYALKKKNPSQLSKPEIDELIAICDKMIAVVKAKKGRASWSKYRAELIELLENS